MLPEKACQFPPGYLLSVYRYYLYFVLRSKYSYAISIGYFCKNLSDKFPISYINCHRLFHLDFEATQHYYSVRVR